MLIDSRNKDKNDRGRGSSSRERDGGAGGLVRGESLAVNHV